MFTLSRQSSLAGTGHECRVQSADDRRPGFGLQRRQAKFHQNSAGQLPPRLGDLDPGDGSVWVGCGSLPAPPHARGLGPCRRSAQKCLRLKFLGNAAPLVK